MLLWYRCVRWKMQQVMQASTVWMESSARRLVPYGLLPPVACCLLCSAALSSPWDRTMNFTSEWKDTVDVVQCDSMRHP